MMQVVIPTFIFYFSLAKSNTSLPPDVNVRESMDSQYGENRLFIPCNRKITGAI